MGTWTQRIVGIAIMGFVLLMNILSTRYGGFIQVAATIGKLIPVIAILGFGLFMAGVIVCMIKSFSLAWALLLGFLTFFVW